MARNQIDTQPLNYSRKDLLKARARFIFRNHKKPIMIIGTILILGAARMAMAPSCSAAENPQAAVPAQTVKEIPEKKPMAGEEKSEISAEQKELNDELIYASAKGKTWLVGKLLDKGADVDAKDKDGYTSLMRAVLNRHKKTTDLLMEREADENAENNWGSSVHDMTTDSEIKAILRKPRFH